MRNKQLIFLLASGSSLALFGTGAFAQAVNTAPSDQVEEVVVTGSLVVSNGFQAPTPVTVVSAEQLRDVSPSIIGGLSQLPQLGSSTSAFSPGLVSGGGNTTVSAENLRNLGVSRTLILTDGRRTVPSSNGGATDVSMIPDLLIKRVDIVTGGASAVYGSDAVAGVVNFILDTNFVGVKAQIQGGVSGQNDAPLYSASVAAGTSFDDGRGNIIVAGDFGGQSGLDGSKRAWDNRGCSSFSNPNTAAGQPSLLLRCNVSTINATYGGVIDNTALKGTAFDVNGNPYNLFNPTATNLSGNQSQEIGPGGARVGATISAGTNAEHLFTHVKYDLTDRVSVFVEAAYGVNSSNYSPVFMNEVPTSKNFTIFSGNAYLPASIQKAMTAQGIQSFQLGRIDQNQGGVYDYNYNDTQMVTVGADVKLWGDWVLNSYLQSGANLLHYGGRNDSIQENIYNASDAVFSPTTGAIVCRSTLTNPNNGCVPVNPFGGAPLTDAQRNYIKGTDMARSLTQQEVASTQAHGTLFSDWAGNISGAAGFTYRHEYAAVTVNALSAAQVTCASFRTAACPAALIGTFGGYGSVNAKPSRGSFDVKEGFGELLVPLATDLPFIESLDVDAAYRYADYSSAGSASTWKVGTTWQPVDDFRLRASMSRDLRAPNVSELFGGQSFTQGTIIDHSLPNSPQTPNVLVYQGSNPNLKPETAITSTAGVVYSPAWLPGFGASVDYYHIDIRGVISVLTPQQTVDACLQGNASICSDIVRNPVTGLVQSLSDFNLNLARLKTSGVDMETNYSTPLYDGNLTVRALASYSGNRTQQVPGALPIYQAGSGSNPDWQANFTAGYRQDDWTLILNERFIGGVHRETPPTTIDFNNTPEAEYTTATIKYDFENVFASPEAYLTVSNLFDQNPRITATNGASGAIYQVTNQLYDQMGRYFTIGVRANL